ncbi:SMC-Scp complex subunit ScpB [Serpentinicella sp. ANB-PHB4]|uniref:SMC-Scp complex subunit ScpB n=1 Tax=Serpentinicella sp. ANB-PHB4 TaxID=3074076 RepID=UPI002860A98E|nr:SMC-Scp complex subunit ScpB [Serpentinicella sp. ANB-PHB4]MDR5658163.1 SMC-Scp complex subunit ScpB [Serpentinicella sp. ANB-PHB4]
MNKPTIKAVLEAVMFAWSEPISINDLSKIVEAKQDIVKNAIEEMKEEYSLSTRGIQIVEMNGYYQLATKPDFHKYLQKLIEPKNNKGLTQAALETLSIIAYKQPITRTGIEEIRGVKCDKAINTLLEKDLISEAGRLEKTGRPILYGTTLNFLKTFGLKSVDDLPDIKDLHKTNNDITNNSIEKDLLSN